MERTTHEWVPLLGSVTVIVLDGAPLERANIIFFPAHGRGTVKSTGRIVGGVYEIPAERGPLAGAMKVEIQPETIDLAELEAARGADRTMKVSLRAVEIPAVYNKRTTLQVHVTDDPTKNNFDFKLVSK